MKHGSKREKFQRLPVWHNALADWNTIGLFTQVSSSNIPSSVDNNHANNNLHVNAKDFVFKPVAHGSLEYTETVALRDEVLRRPLGLIFSPEILGAEAADFHLACYDKQGNLIGCMILTPEESVAEEPATVRMRQVAVRPDHQRGGVGTAFVQYSEEFARAHGFACMTMHARETAVPFYERLGYQRYGERFQEVTIPHWKMRKDLVQ